MGQRERASGKANLDRRGVSRKGMLKSDKSVTLENVIAEWLENSLESRKRTESASLLPATAAR